MREEGGKKHLRKKNFEPDFGKVNEGDEIKQTFDLFLKKIMRATKKNKQKKNIAGKIFVISRNEFVFSK